MTMMRNAVLSGLAVMALAGCTAPGLSPSPIPTPLDRVVKIDPSTAPAGVAAYGELRGSPAYGATVKGALKVHSPDEVARLVGAPEDFKEFLRATIQADSERVVKSLAAEGKSLESEECDSAVEFRVWGTAPTVATGRSRGCDQNSYDVIWAKTGDQWHLVARMQGGWDCAVLNRYHVPAIITGSTCWYDEYKTRAYDGPRN